MPKLDHSRIQTEQPLQWPGGRVRTKQGNKQRSQFTWTRYRALLELRDELSRLRVDSAKITLNLPLRGAEDLPLASAREPDDGGVAIYYTRRRKDHVLACDQYFTVANNLAAAAKTIAAQRGVSRWGCLSIDEAIAGSRLALPGEASGAKPWREVLGVDGEWTQSAPPAALLAYAKAQYKVLIHAAHPDRNGGGGDPTEAAILNAAMEDAERELAVVGEGG